MLRHKKYAHSDEESEDDAMSDISEHEDILGLSTPKKPKALAKTSLNILNNLIPGQL